MFYRDNDRVVGVLCDWDQALDTERPHNEKPTTIEEPTESEKEHFEREQSKKDKSSPGSNGNNEGKPVRPRYRTGTGPFMSCSLLRAGEAPRHEYQFDLESFFWLLA